MKSNRYRWIKGGRSALVGDAGRLTTGSSSSEGHYGVVDVEAEAGKGMLREPVVANQWRNNEAAVPLQGIHVESCITVDRHDVSCGVDMSFLSCPLRPHIHIHVHIYI